jgi:hypothetical protein
VTARADDQRIVDLIETYIDLYRADPGALVALRDDLTNAQLEIDRILRRLDGRATEGNPSLRVKP